MPRPTLSGRGSGRRRRRPRTLWRLVGLGVAGAGLVLRSLGAAGRSMAGGIGPAIGRAGTERARLRRLASASRSPLLSLQIVHPEARRGSQREVGVRAIPLEEIAGTAVEGPAQRGGDFLPLKPLRTRNWKARWYRIRNATADLVALPPIDVVLFGDRYWVLDGHNRVASALYAGQLEIDAVIHELVLPGEAMREHPESLASVVLAGRDLRAAGEGRFTAGAAESTPGAAELGSGRDASADVPGPGNPR